MAITKEKKEEIVKELTDLFQNSKSVVFADYKGLSVKDSQSLRRKLRENEVSYKVAKKTLIKIAAENAGFPEWVEVDLENKTGNVTRLPIRTDILTNFNEQLVVELYSK